jgi:hypothetical protein
VLPYTLNPMIDSYFPALRTGYAEKREMRPLLAVLDNFDAPSGELPHGEIVESVMLLHGRLKDEEIQNLHGDSAAPFDFHDLIAVPAEQLVDGFDALTVGTTASFYNMVTDNLRLLMEEQPSVRVVNVSQSQTPARLIEPFLGPIEKNAKFRGKLAKGLHLTEDATAAEVISSLLEHTEEMVHSDPDIVAAGARYQDAARQAYGKGIVNVIAAGNQGALAGTLSQMGVHTTPATFRSLLVNDWVTVVGAATRDSQPSKLNSPQSGIEVYALGEQLPFQARGIRARVDGTSVAAPLIASQAAATLKQHPEWTATQLEHDIRFG